VLSLIARVWQAEVEVATLTAAHRITFTWNTVALHYFEPLRFCFENKTRLPDRLGVGTQASGWCGQRASRLPTL
jgi:hypothetical protein